MSEQEKDSAAKSPNDNVESDEINTSELDTVAGGVLALQGVEGGEDQPDAATSHISVGCTCGKSPLSE